MQPVLVFDIDMLVYILQYKYHARFFTFDDSVNAKWRVVNVAVSLHVCQQIHPELIQSQVHNGNAACHIFEVYDLFLQSLELAAAIFEVALFLLIDEVIIACGGHNRNTHSCFHTRFQVDVFIEIEIRPKIHKLYDCVPAADSVDTSETLNNAYWIPVYVVIDAVIAVLQVLTFGDAVRRDQNVDLGRLCLLYTSDAADEL